MVQLPQLDRSFKNDELTIPQHRGEIGGDPEVRLIISIENALGTSRTDGSTDQVVARLGADEIPVTVAIDGPLAQIQRPEDKGRRGFKRNRSPRCATGEPCTRHKGCCQTTT